MRSRDRALVERIEGVPLEQAIAHGRCQQAPLLLHAAIEQDASQLQVVKAEHVRQRAVGLRQDADHAVDGLPCRAGAAIFSGNRQGSNSSPGTKLTMASHI